MTKMTQSVLRLPALLCTHNCSGKWCFNRFQGDLHKAINATEDQFFLARVCECSRVRTPLTLMPHATTLAVSVSFSFIDFE